VMNLRPVSLSLEARHIKKSHSGLDVQLECSVVDNALRRLV
jgi:hypothetical protein